MNICQNAVLVVDLFVLGLDTALEHVYEVLVEHLRFLSGSAKGRMVAAEWIPDRQLGPSLAEFVVCVSSEATSVRAYERYSEHVEIHHIRDRFLQVIPVAVIVAQPVGREFATSD